MPVGETFLFDTDEGQELIKAVLYTKDFTFSSQIWSDQPPLLTIVLSHWFGIFGTSVLAARLLILCFSTLAIWSFCQILRFCLGNLLAIVATFLLCVSCNFLRLSVSVMIGMPAIALTLLSIYSIISYLENVHIPPEKILLEQSKIFTRRQQADPPSPHYPINPLSQVLSHIILLLLSGAFFGIALQFKMFVIFLIPLFCFILCDLTKIGKMKIAESIFPALIWLLSAGTTFTLLGIAFGSLDLGSILNFHVSSNLKDVFVRENSAIDVLVMFLQDFDYVLLTGIGVAVILKKRSKIHLFPLIWLFLSTLLLLNHKPLWYHHYILLSLPLTWLASYGVSLAVPIFKTKLGFSRTPIAHSSILPKIAAGFCIFSLVVTPIKLGVIQWQNQLFAKESQDKFAVVNNILEYKKNTRWLFTDNPGYAFYSNILVPPEIAVLSRKRVASGEVTQEYLNALLKKYQPEQIILERFPEVYEPIRPELEANYSKIYEKGSTRHFVRR
ncbi:glycosyltransferase family 39 protein [Lusitaniella coriacea LEGE 07167]